MRKVGGLLLGTLVVLAGAELAFRLTGLALGLARRGAPGGAARYTILSEGDSFTYGIGGMDFPSQLEGILNGRAGRRLFRSVNKGVSGLNTALLADTLEGHIREFRPDAVIVVAGENNSWNSIRLGDDRALPARLALESVLLRSRVYRFAKVMTIGWRHKTFHEAAAEREGLEAAATHLVDESDYPGSEGGPDPVPARRPELFDEAARLQGRGDFAGAGKLYREFIGLNPSLARGYSSLAQCALRRNRLDEGVSLLEKAARLKPTENTFVSLGWAWYRKGRLDDAVAAWKRGLAAFPKSRNLYRAMAKVLHERGQLWGALDAEREIPAVRDNPLHRYLAALAERHGKADSARLVSESFRRDIRRICAIGRVHGVPVIFGSYPDAVHPETAETAAAEGADFVDFSAIFKARFRSRPEYISGDNCHCNTAGYRVMAEAFADVVERRLGLARAPHGR